MSGPVSGPASSAGAEPTPLRFRDAGDGWHLRPHRPLGVRLLGVALALAALGGASLASQRGVAGLAVYLVMLAAALVLQVLPRRAVGRREARTVTAPEGRGLLLPGRPASVTSVLAAGALAVLVWLLPLLLWPLVDPSPGRGTPSLVAVVLTVTVCVIGGLLLALSAARGVRSMRATDEGLLLLPEGPVLRTQSPAARLVWDEVRGVEACWTRARGRSDALRAPEDLVQNWLVLEVDDPAVLPAPWAVLSRQPHPALDVRTLGVDPGTALALCRHYLTHPADRAELRGEAGVQRAAASGAET